MILEFVESGIYRKSFLVNSLVEIISFREGAGAGI